MSMNWFWSSASQDAEKLDQVRASTARIQAAVGGPQLPRYPNYAVIGTLINDIYGDKVAKLRAVAQRVDPAGVMRLAGGFKI